MSVHASHPDAAPSNSDSEGESEGAGESESEGSVMDGGAGVGEGESMSEGTSADEHVAAVQMQSLVRGHMVRRHHSRGGNMDEPSSVDLGGKVTPKPKKVSKHLRKAEKGIEVARQRRETALAEAKQREEEEKRKQRRIQKSERVIGLSLVVQCYYY